jgi:hypothetical protein
MKATPSPKTVSIRLEKIKMMPTISLYKTPKSTK